MITPGGLLTIKVASQNNLPVDCKSGRQLVDTQHGRRLEFCHEEAAENSGKHNGGFRVCRARPRSRRDPIVQSRPRITDLAREPTVSLNIVNYASYDMRAHIFHHR